MVGHLMAVSSVLRRAAGPHRQDASSLLGLMLLLLLLLLLLVVEVRDLLPLLKVHQGVHVKLQQGSTL